MPFPQLWLALYFTDIVFHYWTGLRLVPTRKDFVP